MELRYIILAVGMFLAYASSNEISYCSNGYSVAQAGGVDEYPLGTISMRARNEMQCAMQCLQSKTCFQLFYDPATGTCSVVQNLTSVITITHATGGRMLSIPNPAVPNRKSCASIQCPAGSVCKSDCSSGFGGPMCVADNTQCLQSTEIVNVKHYYNAVYNDDTDIGVVHTIQFNKTSSDTAVRVQWYATTRHHYHQVACCGRHYVTFNGAECTNPNTIDFSNYDYLPNNYLRFSEIDGICYGIPSGMITIAINVGACGGWCLSDTNTGWDASRSMWIYEIKSAPAGGFSYCPFLPIFNTQYLTAKGTNVGDPDTILLASTYTKLASDTALRVKYLATARVAAQSGGGYCARWYVTLNGSECNPKAEFMLGMYSNTQTYASDNHKTRTLEGVCMGLAAGTYSVAVHVGTCYYATAAPDSETGNVNGVSRLIMDEVRLGTSVQAVLNSNGQIMKLPSFNYQHWSWFSISSDLDTGVILSVTYTKLSDDSGLHIHTMNTARIHSNSGCCRWYFTIDGAECSNPGAIEGVLYTEYAVDYQSPGVLDGVCLGVLSGVHTIGYAIGGCNGFVGPGDCATGYGSTTHMMVEEVQPDAAVTCATPFTCP